MPRWAWQKRLFPLRFPLFCLCKRRWILQCGEYPLTALALEPIFTGLPMPLTGGGCSVELDQRGRLFAFPRRSPTATPTGPELGVKRVVPARMPLSGAAFKSVIMPANRNALLMSLRWLRGPGAGPNLEAIALAIALSDVANC